MLSKTLCKTVRLKDLYLKILLCNIVHINKEKVQNLPHCTRIEEDVNGCNDGGLIKPGARKEDKIIA